MSPLVGWDTLDISVHTHVPIRLDSCHYGSWERNVFIVFVSSTLSCAHGVFVHWTNGRVTGMVDLLVSFKEEVVKIHTGNWFTVLYVNYYSLLSHYDVKTRNVCGTHLVCRLCSLKDGCQPLSTGLCGCPVPDHW